MTSITVPSFWARIFVGFKEHYSGSIHSLDEAREIAQAYVNEVGLCVTLEPTEFVYTNGGEPGVVVGLINYPRFPSSGPEICEKALALATLYLDAFKQYRITVMMPEDTVMLCAEERP